MDKQQTEQLKKSLLQEKAALEAQLSQIAKKNPAVKGDWTSVPQDISDPADSLDEKAQTVTNLEERRAIEQNLELRLKEIDETLEKLDKGSYGICSNCNLPIDKKRLIAKPAVKFCIVCATKTTLA
ncbi:MAG: TraR/DksA C4-type zinc finger protein [Patescibacteria group bacterium]